MACRVYQKVRYIPRMAIQREITVKLANRPGALSRVSQLLGGERINMLAMSIDPSGHLRMVVDNPLHAANTLREQHYNVDERDVRVAKQHGRVLGVAEPRGRRGLRVVQHAIGAAHEIVEAHAAVVAGGERQ